MLLYSSYKTGEICPKSGYWSHLETDQTIPLSKGEYFPASEEGFARWKLKQAVRILPFDM